MTCDTKYMKAFSFKQMNTLVFDSFHVYFTSGTWAFSQRSIHHCLEALIHITVTTVVILTITIIELSKGYVNMEECLWFVCFHHFCVLVVASGIFRERVYTFVSWVWYALWLLARASRLLWPHSYRRGW